jgi:hypothetical protein
LTITSVEHAFHLYRNKVGKIDKLQFNKKIQTIKKFLDNNIRIKYSELVKSGSYGRNTHIWNGADIDLVLLLDSNRPKDHVSSIRKTIFQNISAAATNVEEHYHAITFNYNSIKVDLVPAWGPVGGPWHLINSSLKDWELTDPKKNLKILNEANEANRSRIKPTIQLFKAWNIRKKHRFRSFHLETIVIEEFKNNPELKQEKFSTIFDRIARQLSKYIDKTIDEPAKVGPKLSIPQRKRATLKSRVNKLISILNKINAQKQFDGQITLWKQVFGDDFGKI